MIKSEKINSFRLSRKCGRSKRVISKNEQLRRRLLRNKVPSEIFSSRRKWVSSEKSHFEKGNISRSIKSHFENRSLRDGWLRKWVNWEKVTIDNGSLQDCSSQKNESLRDRSLRKWLSSKSIMSQNRPLFSWPNFRNFS